MQGSGVVRWGGRAMQGSGVVGWGGVESQYVPFCC